MSNLGPQFTTKDWNPFLAASNLLDRLATQNKAQYQQRMAALAAQARNEKAKSKKPVKKSVTQPEEPQMTTATTVAPATSIDTAIHPTTGMRVPRVPVKPKGAKPTPPGTKPKKKK